MICTELIFLLLLFVIRSTPDCVQKSGFVEFVNCSGHFFDSFTDIGENIQDIVIHNPPKAVFIVDKSKKQYLHKIQSLNLESTESLIISEHGFKDFVSLSRLFLRNCSIEALKGTWFLVNNNITIFDCSHNKLRTLSKNDLENLKKLHYADFSHNLLESIEPNAFFEMKDLRELRLEGNKLKSIPTGSLPMLNIIRLNHNLIEIVPENVFTEMPKLEHIYLHTNALRKIEDGAFKDLNNLYDLVLSNNFIEEIGEFTFAGLSERYLYRLAISSNKIRRIAPGAFKEVLAVNYLDFSNNSINELNEDIFEGFDAVLVMFDFNKIEIIGNNTFGGLKSLSQLSLNNNKLLSLTAEIFGANLPNLHAFSVSGNSISKLDSDVFKFIPNIFNLAISSNKIQFLPEDIFIPLTILNTLRMQDNLIEELTEGHIDSLKSLTRLFIDHNKLTFLPLNRDSFPNLEEMNIGGNPWQCACLTKVQNFLTEKNITFFKKYYFDGRCPVCVPTYFDHCETNTAFARFIKISEIYKDPNIEQCRINAVQKLTYISTQNYFLF